MLGREIKVNEQLSSIAFHNTAPFSLFSQLFSSYQDENLKKNRGSRKNQEKKNC